MRKSRLKILNMVLLINTAIEKKIILALKEREKIIKKEIKIKGGQAEKIISELNKFLNEHKVDIDEIEGIVAITGPGKFTSLRVGVSMANAMAFSLNIPVVGISLNQANALRDMFSVSEYKLKKTGEHIIVPFYGQEPHITVNKH